MLKIEYLIEIRANIHSLDRFEDNCLPLSSNRFLAIPRSFRVKYAKDCTDVDMKICVVKVERLAIKGNRFRQ